jgi:uroporphyrinogen decarboxylase
MAQPVLKSVEDVASLKPIDPMKDGLMPKALEEYQYMWDHLDRKYIDEYGYLEGVAMSFGPVELAAVIMGYRDFYLNLRAEPERMHSLMAITTESVLRWLRAQEKINGSLKRIGIADHIPGQISQEHFEEYWLPYSNQVVKEFPSATVIYHNEYPVPYIDALARFKFHVWHFGSDLGPAKAALEGHQTLMGNLHPIQVLLQGSPGEVYEKALACLKEGATGGRFLLSSGGGLAPDTPRENLKSIEKAYKHFMEGVTYD